MAGLGAAHGLAALDRRARLNMTAKREGEMEKLVNDLAENMNLRRWKRADLIECINWQQWQLCNAANDKASLRMKMLEVITSDMLPNGEVCDGGRKTSELKQDVNRHSQD